MKTGAMVGLMLLALVLPAAAESVRLADLNLRLAYSQWGDPQINRNVKGQPLVMGGSTYENGLGVSSYSRIPIVLEGHATRFSATVGMDDWASNRNSHVEFLVHGDNRSLWTSGRITAGDTPKAIDLDLQGVQFLELFVHDGGDGTSGDYANWISPIITCDGASPVVAEPDALPTNLPRIVWLNYDPSGDRLVTNQFNLGVEKRKGKYYLKDLAKTQAPAWYTVNGTVNRKDARKLPEGPFPAGRWLTVNKLVADAPNVNEAGSSIHYINSKTPALAYSAICYIDDGKPAPKLKHTEPLWPATPFAVTNPLFMAIPPFSPAPGKQYSTGVPAEIEPATLTERYGWCTGPEKYTMFYTASVGEFIKQMGVEKPHGLDQFTEEEVSRAADILASMTPAKFFSVDFEPGHPEEEGWIWSNNSPQTYRLSEIIFERYDRYFCSWMNAGTRFSFGDTADHVDGYNTADWGGRVDDWIAYHESPDNIRDVKQGSAGFVQLTMGYNSTELNNEDSKADGPEKWRSPMTWSLRTLDLLNFQSLVTDERTPLLMIYWPYEDGAQFGLITPMVRYKLPGYRGHYRQAMARVPLPANLIRDTLIVHQCNPRFRYTEMWGAWGGMNPMGALIYARVNGEPVGRRIIDVGENPCDYVGPDNPPQPEKEDSYYGSGLDAAVLVQAHEVFSRHLSNVCDGTQVREAFPFTYRRQLDGPNAGSISAVWKDDTAEFARAFKHEQPWLQLWKNPKTGRRVLLFQDPFAEPFESVEFTVTIEGKTLKHKATGNNLFCEVLK